MIEVATISLVTLYALGVLAAGSLVFASWQLYTGFRTGWVRA